MSQIAKDRELRVIRDQAPQTAPETTDVRADLLARLRDASDRADRAEERARHLEERCADLLLRLDDAEGAGRSELTAQLERSEQHRRLALQRLDEVTLALSRLPEHPDLEAEAARLADRFRVAEAERAAADVQARGLERRLTDAQAALPPRPSPAAAPAPRAAGAASLRAATPGKAGSRRTTAAIAAAAAAGLLVGGGAVLLADGDGDGATPPAAERPSASAPAAAPAAKPAAAETIPDCSTARPASAGAPLLCGTRSAVLTIVEGRRPLLVPGVQARVLSSSLSATDVRIVARVRNVSSQTRQLFTPDQRPYLTVAGRRLVEAAPPAAATVPVGETARIELRYRLDDAARARIAQAGADLAVRPLGASERRDGRRRLGVIRLRPS